MINFLASLGAGFDCASTAEMQLVLSQGIAPGRIVFSNPCKMKKDLRFARAHEIRKTTFDNADELYKIKSIYPEAQLFIRIYATDVKAKYDLGEKFGASEESASKLLQLAKKLSLNIIGVSFHVGSGAVDPQAFENAICQSKALFNYGRTLGFKMHFLDIGGGFDEKLFPLISAQVSHSLNSYFANDVEVIAEPGRFFAEGAMALACNVIARRQAMEPTIEGAFDMLYLNDGLYGNFLSYAFEQPAPTPQVLYGEGEYFPDEVDGGKKTESSTYFIWGPTCDGCDFINKNIKMRSGLKIGDWLYYKNMGGECITLRLAIDMTANPREAYSSALTTSFNGFGNKRNDVYIGTTSMSSSFLRDQKPVNSTNVQ